MENADRPDSQIAQRLEPELRRTHRALRAISLCNQLLVRATDEVTLLNGICRLLVEHGGYRMAWVGLAEPDDAKSVRPVAQAGFEAGYLATVHIHWDDSERGRGPTGSAIRTRQPVVIRNTAADPTFAPWRSDALQRGYAAVTGLPLMQGNCGLGALTVYSATPETFDANEVALLFELANDIAYGLTALRTRVQHQRAEAALRQSEERLREVLDHAHDLIYRRNLQTLGYDYISASARQHLGYPADEIIRNHAQIVLPRIHPDDLTRVEEMWHRAQTGQETTGILEYRFRHQDGQYRWLSDRFTVFNDSAGRPLYWLGVSRDVTQDKQQVDALREEQEEMALAVAGSDGAVWQICMDPTQPELLPDKMAVSLRLKEFIGFRDDEFPNSVAAWYSRIHPDDVATVRASAQSHTAGNTPTHRVEYRIRHKDGSWRWIASIGHLFRDPYGQVVRWTGIDWDITDRKRTEAELERLVAERTQAWIDAQQQFQSIFDSSTDAVAYTNLAGCPLHVNSAYEALTGYTAAELQQLTIPQITPVEYHEFERRSDAVLLSTGQPQRYEKDYIRKDGTRVPVALTVFLVRNRDAQPVGMAAIVRDLTEPRRLQREILEVSDRERRRIGQDLHDDLCQMLTGITLAIGSLEERLAADHLPAADAAHAIGELLQRANREAHNIAHGLYPTELEIGGLPAALQRLADDITRVGQTRCELLCDAPVALSDPVQALHIYRIIQEAVANAHQHGAATVISITLQAADGRVSVAVANNGRDWPGELAKGTGMGLSIMAYRARTIGGTLQICRGATGGTVVELTVPVTSGS